MENSIQSTINNSTHNSINITGGNNKVGNISLSSSCSLKSKIMQKINHYKKAYEEAAAFAEEKEKIRDEASEAKEKAEKAYEEALNALEATPEYKAKEKAKKAYEEALEIEEAAQMEYRDALDGEQVARDEYYEEKNKGEN